MSLHSEILEQPDRLSGLLASRRKTVEEIAAAIRRRRVRYVFLAARGTSDNAGRYANYLLGAANRLPVALAAPSLFTYYESPPTLTGALVVGISQSGQSPDIVSVVAEGRRQGCLTLAITNTSASPLANAADFVLEIGAGLEESVAATKTYTAELVSIAMLSAALSGSEASWSVLAKVPRWLSEMLQIEQAVAASAPRYRTAERAVVLGRGFNYCTAFEWALKLTELAYIEAAPYSPADFQHGPIAMIEGRYPVLAVLAAGKVADAFLPLLQTLRRELKADLVVVSNVAEALALAEAGFPLPTGIPEELTPIVAIVAGQLFAYHLALAKGLDPERPRTISKITETR